MLSVCCVGFCFGFWLWVGVCSARFGVRNHVVYRAHLCCLACGWNVACVRSGCGHCGGKLFSVEEGEFCFSALVRAFSYILVNSSVVKNCAF